jgi:hypothetical protein
MEAEPGADGSSVWRAAEAHLRSYLEDRGLTQVAIERSADLPRPNVRGGKLARLVRT